MCAGRPPQRNPIIPRGLRMTAGQLHIRYSLRTLRLYCSRLSLLQGPPHWSPMVWLGTLSDGMGASTRQRHQAHREWDCLQWHYTSALMYARSSRDHLPGKTPSRRRVDSDVAEFDGLAARSFRTKLLHTRLRTRTPDIYQANLMQSLWARVMYLRRDGATAPTSGQGQDLRRMPFVEACNLPHHENGIRLDSPHTSTLPLLLCGGGFVWSVRPCTCLCLPACRDLLRVGLCPLGAHRRHLVHCCGCALALIICRLSLPCCSSAPTTCNPVHAGHGHPPHTTSSTSPTSSSQDNLVCLHRKRERHAPSAG